MKMTWFEKVVVITYLSSMAIFLAFLWIALATGSSFAQLMTMAFLGSGMAMQIVAISSAES